MRSLIVIFGTLLSTQAFADINYSCPASGKDAVHEASSCLDKAKHDYSEGCCFENKNEKQLLNPNGNPWQCNLDIKQAKCSLKHDRFSNSDRWICQVPSDCSDLSPIVNATYPTRRECKEKDALPFFHLVKKPSLKWTQEHFNAYAPGHKPQVPDSQMVRSLEALACKKAPKAKPLDSTGEAGIFEAAPAELKNETN